ncbi:MAG: hypothetical protein AB7G23_06340 [Vicinamibacterales bacterium]
MSAAESVPATCLGCGCACDDITLEVREGRIVAARQACALGAAWFGDGVLPARALVDGRAVTVPDALDEAARVLGGAARPLVYLAPHLTCEAQRECVGLGDAIGATVDSATSSGALPGLLAAQEMGRVSATLAEVRYRADLVVFWAVDPAVRYPRFVERYLDAPLPDGRPRRLLAVDVGEARGPDTLADRLWLAPADEVTVLMQATAGVGPLAARLGEATCVAVIVDGEPDGPEAGVREAGTPVRAPSAQAPSPQGLRTRGLLALTRSLHDTRRAALVTLRAGGNVNGADACLTWQTGYPAAVDLARGTPRYRPCDGRAVDRLRSGRVDVALVAGGAAQVPADVAARLSPTTRIFIGPGVSASPLAAGAHVVVDTGVPGVHEAGTALRLDDVPLPLRAVLPGPPSTAATARALRLRLSGGWR